jgi:hypothetical protein
MAGKVQTFEQLVLNRAMRRLTTAVSGSNASTTNILVASSTGFVVGDVVQLTTPGSYHVVSIVPDGTHVTVSPAAGAAPTTGNVVAIAYSWPAVYVGLFSTAPTDTTGGTEFSGGNYARQQIALADGSWNAPSGSPSAITNVATPSWAGITWTGLPGTILAWGLFPTLSGGTVQEYAACSVAVASGNTVTFNAAAITITED